MTLPARRGGVFRICLTIILTIIVSSCGPGTDRGAVAVAIIGDGDGDDLFQSGVRLSTAAQHLRGSTNEGLVGLDPAGQVVPAIAERWIVTDDGLSYIFRLRNSNWPDGEAITAAEARILLEDTIRRLDGTSLGLDLAKITEIRAMTGRVVELRLSGPMPDFLRLLAQPELGFVNQGNGAGPMVMSGDEESVQARLRALPPQERGLPAREDWAEVSRGVTVQALPGRAAVDAFANGEVDVLMGGTIATFPMAQLGPLSRGTVQVDPTLGVFGLMVRRESGVLSDAALREALSMAIDRSELIQPFGLGGWQASQWLVPQELFSPAQYPQGRWGGQSIEDRRNIATRRIAQWAAQSDEEPTVRVGLPDGPGSDLLFEELSNAWQAIGVTSVRAGLGEGADLELHDRLARYSSPRWFLNQFNCSLEMGLCSAEADALIQESLTLKDPEAKLSLLVDAHALLTQEEVFIPLGAPVRWSLVRGGVNGYQANQWGLHPLFPLSQPTT
ncbi:ABC transporter substrate-binding protein [Erythrobacter sp. Alg231-14]|uniref:ABC transporter substrate-binding protein n=1 Tax=Erythrobacter sp. Alg231-14 TaxID=1922225 RepID=UPI00307BB404